MKVILLGNGRVGKTQLCRRLRGEPFDEKVESTHGVKIWRRPLRIGAGARSGVPCPAGGISAGRTSTTCTAPHALFLRSRAVFLVLWTPSLENREESEENCNRLRQPANRVLAGLRAHARGQGQPGDRGAEPVRRVRRPPSRPARGRRGSECFRVLRVQCQGGGGEGSAGEGFSRSQLGDALRFLRERDGAVAIGRGRAVLRRRLYATWREEDQEREGAARRHRTLSVADFRALCDEVGGIVSWEHALDYLHQAGVVFYRADLFSSCIVLDQDLGSRRGLRGLRPRAEPAPWLRDSGRFTREDLAVMVWPGALGRGAEGFFWD